MRKEGEGGGRGREEGIGEIHVLQTFFAVVCSSLYFLIPVTLPSLADFLPAIISSSSQLPPGVRVQEDRRDGDRGLE
jgi:hypothetical protein